MLSFPRYATETVKYLPIDGSISAKRLFRWKIAAVNSWTLEACNGGQPW